MNGSACQDNWYCRDFANEISNLPRAEVTDGFINNYLILKLFITPHEGLKAKRFHILPNVLGLES